MAENRSLINPFPGLRPFEQDEDHLFFGCDGQRDELLRRLRCNRFVAVVGTSGSGKSSLVRAGLLPALHGGLMAKTEPSWRVAVVRPGSNPMGNLAAALAAWAEPDALADAYAAKQQEIVETTLRRGALGLVDAVRQARLSPDESLLLVIDQFEEIFRFKQDPKNEQADEQAAAFVKLFLEAVRQTEVPIYVVLTMRSEYLGDCAQFRDLPEAINNSEYLLPRMTRDQRREAIEGPVAVRGAQITSKLVNRLLNDVGDNPDQLPILQHALMRTWNYWVQVHRDSEPIDVCHYEAIGGMAGALSKHAEEAYDELPDQRSRDVAERLFKCLTERGVHNREVRRPKSVAEICDIAGATQEEVIAVVEMFRRPPRSFLTPTANLPLDANSLIDISHESLIGGWQRLKEWVESETLSAGIYYRVAETAVLHRENKAGLWRDPDLLVALGWRDKVNPNKAWSLRYHPEFEAAIRFLEDSKAARDADTVERESQSRKELRRTRITAVLFAFAFFVTLAIMLYALNQRREAISAKKDALQAKRSEQLEAMRTRKLNLDDKNMIVALADKLIERSTPEEEFIWHLYKAEALSQLGRHDDSINEYNLVLKLDSANLRALLSRGYEHLILGHAEESRADTAAYLKADSRSWLAHLNLSIALGTLGDYEGATGEITKSLNSFDYTAEEFLENEVSPDIQKATRHKMFFVDEDSAPTALRYQIANLSAFAGGEGFEAALKEADERTDKTVHDNHAKSVVGYLVALNWAWLHWKERNEDYGALASQGALWRRAGLNDWAWRSYEAFEKQYAAHPQSRYESLAKWVKQEVSQLAPTEVERPDADMLAIEAWEQYFNADAHRSMSADEALPDMKRANDAITAAAQLEPKNMDFLLKRLHIRFGAEQYEDLRDDCDEVLRLAPNTSLAYYYRAMARKRMGIDTDENKADFLKALEYSPVDSDILIELSDEISETDPNKALEYLELSLRVNVSSETIPWIYERIAQLERDQKKALKAIEIAIMMKGDETRLYTERAEIERRLGTENESEVKRNLAAGYRKVGDIKSKMCKPDEAREAYTKSREVLAGQARK